jgi:methyltransferase (TIGR00027 family)
MAFAIHAPSGYALKPGEVSYSAEFAAGLRAIASKEPDEKIRNPDYLAKQFVTPNFWFLGPMREEFEKSQQFIKFYRMGYYYTVNACTWHIDGILTAIAENGLKQVVMIGAGFDTRPYRFGKQMPGVAFYEVDLPATQALKKKLVTEAFGSLPKNVSYIGTDYRSRPLFEALKRAGYDDHQKTLFIWEGSTLYTDKHVVDENLRTIAAHTGKGSEVVFDFIPQEIVAGDYSKYRRAGFASVRTDASGEPWMFGIPEGTADAYVAERGFTVISNLGSVDLAKKYLVRSDGALAGSPTAYMRIVHAVVNP